MAEVGAAVSVFSDSRLRGYSLSGGHPVGIVDVSYDDASGLYAAASASAFASSNDGIKPLGLQLNGGYAKRLSGVTLDFGAIYSTYSNYSSRGSSSSYTEIYAGAGYKFLSSRIAFSPHYSNAAQGRSMAKSTPISVQRASSTSPVTRACWFQSTIEARILPVSMTGASGLARTSAKLRST